MTNVKWQMNNGKWTCYPILAWLLALKYHLAEILDLLFLNPAREAKVT
jgi:hypothetical protein